MHALVEPFLPNNLNVNYASAIAAGASKWRPDFKSDEIFCKIERSLREVSINVHCISYVLALVRVTFSSGYKLFLLCKLDGISNEKGSGTATV